MEKTISVFWFFNSLLVRTAEFLWVTPTLSTEGLCWRPYPLLTAPLCSHDACYLDTVLGETDHEMRWEKLCPMLLWLEKNWSTLAGFPGCATEVLEDMSSPTASLHLPSCVQASVSYWGTLKGKAWVEEKKNGQEPCQVWLAQSSAFRFHSS